MFMIIELAIAGMLQCNLVAQRIVKEDLNCYYICTDYTKEFASTLKQYRCPSKIYEDRAPLPWKEQDRSTKWDLKDK